MSTQTVYLSHQKKKRVVLLSYDEAKNDPCSLQAMEDEITSFKRFD
jgi:peroxiredoxin